MKRMLTLGLTLLLALSLLTACGGNNSGESPPAAAPAPASNSGNNTSSPAKQDARVIKSSEIITLEDAKHILGTEVKAHDEKFDLINPLNPGTISTTYVSVEDPLYYISIILHQDALLDPNVAVDKGMIDKGGIAGYNARIRPARESQEAAVILEGIGDWACITGYDKLKLNNLYAIDIAYGDYCIEILLIGWPKGTTVIDEEKIDWKTEKFMEAGKRAIERLDAIIK